MKNLSMAIKAVKLCGLKSELIYEAARKTKRCKWQTRIG